jgi:hypothetical protein
MGVRLGVRLGAGLDVIRLGGKPSFTGPARWFREPWSMEQLLHVALAAVAILGWSLVYMTLTRGIDPPQVAKDSLRTEVSINLAPQR